jgi:hypothetical protein
MKTPVLALAIILFVTSASLAQNDSSRMAQMESTLKRVEEWIKDKEKEEDIVGIFKLKKTDLLVSTFRKGNYFKMLHSDSVNRRDSSSYKIQRVKINIKDGAIVDIQVFTKSGEVFTNFYAPLNLNQFTEENYVLTYKRSDDSIKQIFTKDFLEWEREHGFAPSDIVFELDSAKLTRTLYRGVGINQVIDVRLFTDLSALFSDKPNGLTQTEAFYKVITNAQTIRTNTFIRRYGIIPFRYVSGNVIFSKFDSKFATTQLDSAFTRQKLLRRSTINVDVTVNLYANWTSKKSNSWFYLNAGGGFFSSQLGSELDTSSVVMPYWYIDPLFELKGSQNFGIDISLRMLRQYAPQLSDSQRGWRYIWRPQMTVYWNPLNAPGNRIFGRVTYFADVKDTRNPFFQVQLGYSLLISQLIKERTKASND